MKTSDMTTGNPRESNPRILTIDILRGMALFGILIVHIIFNFSAWAYMSTEQKEVLNFASINQMAADTIVFLFKEKSRVLFALMFGISFYFQLEKFKRKGDKIQFTYLKRMGVLLLFGLIHAHLLFNADILRYYAFCGLILLLVFNWSSKSLVSMGLILAVLVPTVSSIVIGVFGFNVYASIPPVADLLAMIVSPSFSDNLMANHILANLRYHWILLCVYAIPVAGIFMLGLWMARKGLFHRPEDHLSLLKKMMIIGLSVGFFLQIFTNQILIVLMGQTQVFYILRSFLSYLSPVVIIFGFVPGLILLCQLPHWAKRLSFFAPAGKMTLTNYFMQSLFPWIFYYGSGMGLFFILSPVESIFLGIALFAFQVLFSIAWLKKFKIGPLEWVWRRLINGKKSDYNLTVGTEPN